MLIFDVNYISLKNHQILNQGIKIKSKRLFQQLSIKNSFIFQTYCQLKKDPQLKLSQF